jgi:hypothetical protein
MSPALTTRGRALRAAALGLAALTLLLPAASPALAGRQKVVSGATTLAVPGVRVAALTAQDVAVVDVSPATFRFVWDGELVWSFRVPMTAGGTFDHAAGRGTLAHKGGLRFVNVATGASLSLTGLRAHVDGPAGIVLEAAVGGAPVTRAEVLVSTDEARIVKKGRQVLVRDVRLRLTPQLAVALQTALVGTVDTTAVFAVADMSFKLK